MGHRHELQVGPRYESALGCNGARPRKSASWAIRGRFVSLPRGEGRFPVAAVEHARGPHGRRIVIVEAAGVDAELVGVRARHVERVHAAGGAEGMMSRSGIEPVIRHLAIAPQQREIRRRDGDMQDAFFRADRAGALANRSWHGQIGPYPEPDPAAMTAALVGLHRASAPLRGAMLPWVAWSGHAEAYAIGSGSELLAVWPRACGIVRRKA